MGYFKFYHVKEEYIEYLHRVDYRVQHNKGQKRPYVGIVLEINGYKYYVPLESPKPGHAKIKGGGPVLKLEDGALGIMGFNNMLPVKPRELVEFDIAQEQDREYQMLLLKQLHYCTKNKNVILVRAANTYKKATDGNTPFYEKVCCDFKKLEAACKRYNPNWKPKK